MTKAFWQHRQNGFRLTFPNGNSLSTVWGPMTYSDNYDVDVRVRDFSPNGVFDVKAYDEEYNKNRDSDTVEVMATCSPQLHKLLEDQFSDNYYGGVFGRLTFFEWLEIVNIMANNK